MQLSSDPVWWIIPRTLDLSGPHRVLSSSPERWAPAPALLTWLCCRAGALGQWALVRAHTSGGSPAGAVRTAFFQHLSEVNPRPRPSLCPDCTTPRGSSLVGAPSRLGREYCWGSLWPGRS